MTGGRKICPSDERLPIYGFERRILGSWFSYGLKSLGSIESWGGAV